MSLIVYKYFVDDSSSKALNSINDKYSSMRKCSRCDEVRFTEKLFNYDGEWYALCRKCHVELKDFLAGKKLCGCKYKSTNSTGGFTVIVEGDNNE